MPTTAAVQPADRGGPVVPGVAAEALDPLLLGGLAGVMADAGGADADVLVAEEVGDALDRAAQLLQHVVAEPVDVGVLDEAEFGGAGRAAVVN
ncbi:hypothetical protein [Streptomyces sp. NPDC014746]|uniref:hypothetical protein n=1 Tax=Streptomyces sp. NPDC014746 TaxID=3364904 RepID=UPI0036FBD357